MHAEISFIGLFWQASLLVKLVMMTLMGMSVVSWALIIQRSKAIKAAKVVGFEDLGMEAIYEFDVVDMPVTVAVDAGGTSAHITGPAEWQKRIATGEFKGIEVAAA